jgi:hypothetical protein
MNTNTIPEFYFEVAEQRVADKDQEIANKDQKIAELKEELDELRAFISEQRKQKISRDTVISAISDITKEIIELYPSFSRYGTIINEYHRAKLALIDGMVTANNIADYIDKFKSDSQMLLLLQTALQNIDIEEKTYCTYTGKCVNLCKTKSSINAFGWFNTYKGLQCLFLYLLQQMDEIIVSTIRTGHYSASELYFPTAIYHEANSTNDDGIRYRSKEYHAEIWEHKKTFSRRLVTAITAYVETLIK